ncbi:MAG: ParB/RepB/Spo0J family partition protein [PVC group bacterium]
MKREGREILVSDIVGSLCRMRLEEDYEREEMLASIKKHGVMNPVKVKKAQKGGYMIFAGHRRLDAGRELGLITIPAEVWEGISDEEAVLMGFIENINRKDFTQLEEASAYARLIDGFHRAVDDLVESCGKSRSRSYSLYDTIRNLTPEMKSAILEGRMTFGHGEWLLKIEDPALRARLFKQILDGAIDLAELQYRVYRQKPDSEKNFKELQLDVVEDIYEKEPTIQALPKKTIRISRSRKGIRITVDVGSQGELKTALHAILDPVEREKKRFERLKGHRA